MDKLKNQLEEALAQAKLQLAQGRTGSVDSSRKSGVGLVGKISEDNLLLPRLQLLRLSHYQIDDTLYKI